MLLVALTAATWLALIIAAPLLPVPLAATVYALGSHICHQRPERSFHLFAAQLPVCARCLGIYAGAALGSIAALAARIRAGTRAVSPRLLLLCGAVPTAVTVAAEWIGGAAPSNAARASAGLPLGFVVALVVAATLHYGGCAPRRPIASSRPPTPI
ncbi:MAG TPA: DUF2085 domain-containing protein [Vicinamibacterales bacterium]